MNVSTLERGDSGVKLGDKYKVLEDTRFVDQGLVPEGAILEVVKIGTEVEDYYITWRYPDKLVEDMLFGATLIEPASKILLRREQ